MTLIGSPPAYLRGSRLRVLWWYVSESSHWAAAAFAVNTAGLSTLLALAISAVLVAQFDVGSFFWWSLGLLAATVVTSWALLWAVIQRCPIWTLLATVAYFFAAIIPAVVLVIHLLGMLMALATALFQTINWRGYREAERCQSERYTSDASL